MATRKEELIDKDDYVKGVVDFIFKEFSKIKMYSQYFQTDDCRSRLETVARATLDETSSEVSNSPPHEARQNLSLKSRKAGVDLIGIDASYRSKLRAQPDNAIELQFTSLAKHTQKVMFDTMSRYKGAFTDFGATPLPESQSPLPSPIAKQAATSKPSTPIMGRSRSKLSSASNSPILSRSATPTNSVMNAINRDEFVSKIADKICGEIAGADRAKVVAVAAGEFDKISDFIQDEIYLANTNQQSLASTEQQASIVRSNVIRRTIKDLQLPLAQKDDKTPEEHIKLELLYEIGKSRDLNAFATNALSKNAPIYPDQEPEMVDEILEDTDSIEMMEEMFDAIPKADDISDDNRKFLYEKKDAKKQSTAMSPPPTPPKSQKTATPSIQGSPSLPTKSAAREFKSQNAIRPPQKAAPQPPVNSKERASPRPGTPVVPPRPANDAVRFNPRNPQSAINAVKSNVAATDARRKDAAAKLQQKSGNNAP